MKTDYHCVDQSVRATVLTPIKTLISIALMSVAFVFSSCVNDTEIVSVDNAPEKESEKNDFTPVAIVNSQNLSVVVDATDSIENVMVEYEYVWEFSDGTTSHEKVTSHSFSQAGIHSAKLTLIDPNGVEVSSTSSFNLSGNAANVSESQQLEGSLLYDQLNCKNCHGAKGKGAGFPLDFSQHNQASLASVIELTMPKVIGLPEDCEAVCAQRIAQWLLSSDDTPTTLEAVIESGENGLSVSMSPTNSTLNPNETYQYLWTFSDNTTSTEIITSHTFAHAGQHSVSLEIKDSQNNVLSAQKNFNLTGAALNQEQKDITEGELLYASANCWRCHGEHGNSVTQPILFENYNHTTMKNVISTTMPKIFAKPQDCTDQCADKIATWLLTFKVEVSCAQGVTDVLPRRLRKLTNDEYVLTINTLLNRSDIHTKITGFGADSKVHGYKNNVEAGAVTVSSMSSYWDAAKDIAQSTNAASVNQCSSSDMTNCANQFVPEFGMKAFRRPLTSSEEATYKALFAQGSDTAEGTAFVIQAMLSSTHFLYRTELGQNGVLTPFETASLLSYTFWGSMPDDVLFDKAQNNLLQSNAQLEDEARRLIQAPQAQAQFARFAQQWLEVESIAQNKDASGYASYSTQLGEAMDQEFTMFTGKALTSSNTGVDYLFTADKTFVNNQLGQFYGFSNLPNNGFAEVAVNTERGGILNLAALLSQYGKTNSSNPIARGVMVRERLLCQAFGKPPGDVGEVAPISPNLSTRERFRQHTDNTACASCHDKIDDLGFGFERYDGIGQYRTTEGNNIAVSDEGVLRSINNYSDEDEHEFNGTNELSQLLVTQGLTSVEQCVAEQFQIYMQGVAEVDACAPADVQQRWNSADGIVGLWIKSVSTNNFLNRQ